MDKNNKVPPPKPKRSPGVYTRHQQQEQQPHSHPQQQQPLQQQQQQQQKSASAPIFIYEPLPTAPPDLCVSEQNIFQFPLVIRNPCHSTITFHDDHTGTLSCTSDDPDSIDRRKHCCKFCQPYREDRQTIEPLKSRLNSAIKAIDQLNRTYELLDQLLEEKLATIQDSDEQTEQEQQVQHQQQQQESVTSSPLSPLANKNSKKPKKDTEFELEHSLTFLESLFGTEIVPSFKQGAFKRMRERSKSMMEDEIHILKDRTSKLGVSTNTYSSLTRPYLLRRQSTYSDGNKSKVSKWTKVKAAFKWERANVPPTSVNDGIGLTPVNHEVARYLKVPAKPCGGSSSADSIISSSSGHFLSDTGGTPGTISSASSMDDIDASCSHAMRRDSSKSDTRCDSRLSDIDVNAVELRKSATEDLAESYSNSIRHAMPSKSASNKSIRRSKVFSDFEVLPEGHVADIKATSSRRNKLPPSPLNLNQDFNELPNLYSPMSLKSPKDGTQSLNPSVPSSPSRHSDFFGEFESEDISSGDFSEPTTPNRKTFNQKQDEVYQRYQLLLLKLDMEFKAKQRDYERANANRAVPGTALRSGKKSDEHSPTQVYNNDLVSTELLEEKLTPEFKKKLHKWRIKKQNSLAAAYNHAQQQHHQQQQQQSLDSSTSPSIKQHQGGTPAELSKPKFDWNLWSTGQVKLEGQGLCALPEQKDLPEKFQKKLEQWNKIKSGGGGGAASDNDSLKRSSKHNQNTRRGSDDDRWYKHKSHDKEKLAKLKAIVAPHHQTKNIEVETASGVMKFEGISRKFTRKLYEWEKARGIGPEASTFALLHPGYCPIDVRRINKETHSTGADNSPTLSRSLSLDSITPSIALPTITQQASSLSLNNVNELKSTEESADALTDHEFKKDDELEAVMVEVEEHIDDTASPLVTAHTFIEQQTPIYKYEEMQCNDYCNTRRVQSFESHTNLAPLIAALKRADELIESLKQVSPDIVDNIELRNCQSVLLNIRTIYPYYSNNLIKANVLNAISDVQNELGRLTELSLKSPLDEACCQEIMEERDHEYNEEFHGLCEALECLKQNIQGGMQRLPKDLVPDINITSEDGEECAAIYAPYDSTYRVQLPTTLETYDEHSGSHVENETESTATTTYRAPSIAPNNITKKKLRLRKMGSRQNSKTESDSSEAETHSVLETPRRLRRQKFRLKQRSLDDDFRLRSDEPPPMPIASVPTTSADVLYTLKVKPGQPIVESQIVSGVGGVQQLKTPPPPPPIVLNDDSKVKAFIPPPLPEKHMLNYNTNANVFVKTRRKLFTTIVEPNAMEGIAVIEKILDSPTLTEESPVTDTVIEVTNTDEEMPVIQEEAKPSPPPPPSPKSPVSTPVKPQRPKLNMHKSISLDDVTQVSPSDDLRKAQSSQHIDQSMMRRNSDVPAPLAADSFRVINRALSPIHFDIPLTATTRKEHLFKKNSLTKSQTASSPPKIEHKIAKTNSASAVVRGLKSFVLPNRLDNTLPRIQRKLECKTVLTPTKANHFEFPPKLTESNTQLNAVEHEEPPITPISERTLKLQRARAEFLESPLPQTPTTPQTFQLPIRDNGDMVVEKYPIPMDNTWEKATLEKCSSVATMSTGCGDISLPTSDVGTDYESSSIYENVPRSVTRSGKISSKLGFATLASKLRRVKGGGKKKNKEGVPDSSTAGAGSALSTLCRQTLMTDVLTMPQMTIPGEHIASGNVRSQGSVLKSQSSPQAATYRNPIVDRHLEALNKSQSEQYVKYLISKESDV